MPTYEYVCDACDHEFELFQQMSDSPKKKCPDCGKQKLRRLFGTGSAVVFKGSGFYETDYRSDSYKKGAKDAKTKKTEAKSAKSDKKKSDSTSKPAAKKNDS
jgi:putative FmdB family regulatory protein